MSEPKMDHPDLASAQSRDHQHILCQFSKMVLRSHFTFTFPKYRATAKTRVW